jgi:hypothetical protein
LWIISSCGLRDECLNYMLRQFKFKTCLKLWVYSLSDPFKLQTTSSLLLLSLIQKPQCTTRQQCNILFGSTLMVPEAIQSLVACICIAMKVAVSTLSCHGHHNRRLLVVSASKDYGFVQSFPCCCCCVCYIYIFVIWTSPSIRTLNSCRDVQRSYKHNLWQFLLQVQTGPSWYSKFFNSSLSQYLLNLFR